MHQVRAVILTGYAEVAQLVGLDGPRLLREAGFGPEALADPENRLPASEVLNLLDHSAEISGCEDFALLMAERRTLASLGPLSLLLERLPNVREVIRMAIAYRRHLNDVIALSVEDAEGTSIVRLDVEAGFWSTQFVDLYLGITYRILRGVSGERWKPFAIHTLRKPPEDLTIWRRVFPFPTEFESTFIGFSCETASLLVPLPLANETMARNARRLLGLVQVESGPRHLSDRVRRAIVLLLPSGKNSLDDIAGHLGMSGRTLQRRLEAEEHNFGEVLSAVRKDLAAAYLSNSEQPITTVASLLGYSSPSSFTRWFTATFGTTPQAWRAAHATAEASEAPTLPDR